jgi:hypothetical protein
MDAVVSVRALRRRWKPHKERLSGAVPSHPTPVRFHRACSWLARVEAMAELEDADLALVSLWIAFNSLYGQWDAVRREPKADRESWRAFVDRILRLDRDHHVVDALQEHKPLVMSLLEDESLSDYFWRESAARRPGNSKKAKRNAQTWYVDGRWTMIIDELLDRVYLMRCQLVHGAATYGGQLNRTSLRHCVWMLQRLLPAFLQVWIDHGSDEDWGPMCYPPLNSQKSTMAARHQPNLAK